MRFKTKFKLWLWKHNLYKPCPYCGSQLLAHGFTDYNERFTCTNDDCIFGKEDIIKIRIITDILQPLK
jgi:hypothetical protein